MITTSEMLDLEKKAIDNGTTILELMEMAGSAAFQILKEKYDLEGMHVVIFCGGGNNGGDGFVLARYLQLEGIQTVVLFCGMEEKLSDEAKVNFDRIKDAVLIVTIDNPKEFELFNFQKNARFILIDALLGTGVSGSIREPIQTAITLFNSTKGDKISIDVPSGIHPDTGVTSDAYVESDLIITFHDIKAGLLSLKEKTVIADVGLLEKDEVKISKV